MRKTSSSIVISVRLSGRMERLGSHWADFHEIWYLSMFRNSVDKIQVLLESVKKFWCFTRRPMYVCDNISLILPKMITVPDKSCRES